MITIRIVTIWESLEDDNAILTLSHRQDFIYKTLVRLSSDLPHLNISQTSLELFMSMSYTDESYTAQRLETATPPNQSAKPRQSRLRASCDGCFLAKVKCSKAKPICSRCLACGADCRYSPSSRAGKPKSDGPRSSHASLNHTIPAEINMSTDSEMATFGMDRDWSTPGSTDERISPKMISPSVPAMIDSSSEGEGSTTVLPTNADLFQPVFSWDNSNRPEMRPNYATDGQVYLSRSKSAIATPTTIAPWFETQSEFMSPTIQQSPGMTQSNAYNDSTSRSQNCNCFTTCLQSLQALHNHSGPPSSQVVPPFDVVLTVNRRAVEGCSEMLNCAKCLSKGGINTSTMLLATVIGKIMSFYRAASQAYFGFSGLPRSQTTPLPLTFGTYRVAGDDGRWLEMEILLRELRKLEELFSKFQETCQKVEMEDDLGMHAALTTWLGQSLHYTFEVLNMQKEMAFCWHSQGWLFSIFPWEHIWDHYQGTGFFWSYWERVFCFNDVQH